MDKVEEMEIDYEAAMLRRAELRTKVGAELEEKRTKAHARAVLPPNTQIISLHRKDAAAAAPALEVLRPVLMAVASQGSGIINQHFGHAKEFLVYEASSNGVRLIGHRKTELYCGGDETCGEGESTLEKTIKALAGCEVVLCSKVGFEPWGMLEAAGIAPNGEHAMEAIDEAVLAVWQEMAAAGKLSAKPDAASALKRA
jgi:nitrogen fixation protein NifB